MFGSALREPLDGSGVFGGQRPALPAPGLRRDPLPGGGPLSHAFVLPGGVRGLGAGVLERGVRGVLRAGARERGLQHPHRLLLRVVHRARRSGVRVAVVVVVGAGVGGDVGVVGVPAAGHRHVQVLAVHPGPDQHDPHIGGGALGGVDRARPAVLGVHLQVGGR